MRQKGQAIEIAPTEGEPTVNVVLWIVQVLLAALFLFAGVMKLVVPLDQLQGPVAMPGWFIRFIGVAETLGGVGLILPWLLRIKPGLTPLAAAGLVVIMIGAVGIGLMTGDPKGAAIPLLVGVLAAFVMYGRWKQTPARTAPAGGEEGSPPRVPLYKRGS